MHQMVGGRRLVAIAQILYKKTSRSDRVASILKEDGRSSTLCVGCAFSENREVLPKWRVVGSVPEETGKKAASGDRS